MFRIRDVLVRIREAQKLRIWNASFREISFTDIPDKKKFKKSLSRAYLIYPIHIKQSFSPSLLHFSFFIAVFKPVFAILVHPPTWLTTCRGGLDYVQKRNKVTVQKDWFPDLGRSVPWNMDMYTVSMLLFHSITSLKKSLAFFSLNSQKQE